MNKIKPIFQILQRSVRLKSIIPIIAIVFIGLAMFAQNSNSSFSSMPKQNKEINKKHVFFLHNMFLENNDLNAEHPQYGKAAYTEIIERFEQESFVVLSEKRAPNTNVRQYAENIVSQIDSLLNIDDGGDIKPHQITIIGTSKGGYIAQYVSTFLANPNVNYVFIGSSMENDLQRFPDIQFCGNILNIYEESDTYAVSAIGRKEASTLLINQFKEIKLNTQLRHGFLFRPLAEWLQPCIYWINQDFEKL